MTKFTIAEQVATELKVLADCGIEAGEPESFIHIGGTRYGENSSVDLVAFTDRSLGIVVRCGGRSLATRITEESADAVAEWFQPDGSKGAAP